MSTQAASRRRSADDREGGRDGLPRSGRFGSDVRRDGSRPVGSLGRLSLRSAVSEPASLPRSPRPFGHTSDVLLSTSAGSVAFIPASAAAVSTRRLRRLRPPRPALRLQRFGLPPQAHGAGARAGGSGDRLGFGCLGFRLLRQGERVDGSVGSRILHASSTWSPFNYRRSLLPGPHATSCPVSTVLK